MAQDQLKLRHPFLVIGVGTAGSKLARGAASMLECECLQLSTDKRDFDSLGDSIKVDTRGWVKPSVQNLRSMTHACRGSISTRISGNKTVIVISNLAGSNGPGIAPLVCEMAREAGATVVTIAMMPFGFEKGRIFASGIALKRVREKSDSVIIADNDSFLENNPKLSVSECYEIINKSIMHVLDSIAKHALHKEVSLLCPNGGQAELESSFQTSVSMVYQNAKAPETIKRAIIYVQNPELSVGSMATLSHYAEGMFTEVGHTQIEIARTISGAGSQVHMLASGFLKTRFDSYDPLSDIIPSENVLDWDEAECSVETQLPIFDTE